MWTIFAVQIPDKGILYPVAQVFVNLTNSYDKKEFDPEMVELAKYAKQHVPEEHEKVRTCISGSSAGLVMCLFARIDSGGFWLFLFWLSEAKTGESIADHPGQHCKQSGLNVLS